MKRTSMLEQFSVLTSHKSAALIGGLYGAIIPVGIFEIAHKQAWDRPWLWLIVVGGLIYSMLVTYGKVKELTGCKYKAVGYMIFLELTLTLAHGWLTYFALALLVLLNALAFAHALVQQRERVAPKKTTSSRKAPARKTAKAVI